MTYLKTPCVLVSYVAVLEENYVDVAYISPVVRPVLLENKLCQPTFRSTACERLF